MSEPAVAEPGGFAWRPDRAEMGATNVGRFMATHGVGDFDELLARSVRDPSWFWDAVVRFLAIPFAQPYERVLDTSRGIPWATWFVGGRLNLAQVCLDRWAAESPDRPAVIWEGEGGEVRTLGYAALRAEVDALARLLGDRGVAQGGHQPVGVAADMIAEDAGHQGHVGPDAGESPFDEVGRRHDEQRRAVVDGQQVAERVALGEAIVEDDRVGTPPSQRRPHGAAVRRLLDVQTVDLQIIAHGKTDGGLVIDDENRRAFR